MTSGSAKALALLLSRKLGYKVFRVRPGYVPRGREIILNWGDSDYLNISHLNHPLPVKMAINKLHCLDIMGKNGVSVPPWTKDVEEAKQWVKNGKRVVIRKTLTGSGGEGILLAESMDGFVDAPLYTEHVRHKREFRVHVFNGKVIDIQEKKKRNGQQAKNAFIRNHENGWVFCREGIECPEGVRSEALKAIEALRLDFGACDIGWRERDQKAFVFEVNTAPGIEGTTLENYAQEICDLLGHSN